MRLILFIVWILLITTSVHSETVSSDQSAPKLSAEVLNDHHLGRLTRWDYALNKEGEPWLAYYSADGTLYVRRPDGSEIDLRPKARMSSMSGLAIAVGENFGLLWRDKLPRKGLYYTSIDSESETFKPLLIDGQMEPLTRMRVTKSDDETYFLWYGEKPISGNKKAYNYYFRILESDGETLSEIFRVMPGIYPTWIVDDKQIPIFSYTDVDNRPIMAMRSFDREKRSFNDLKKLIDAPHIGPFFFAFKSLDRWFLMWVAHYGQDFKDLLLEGIFSDDQGESWEKFSFKELQGLNFSQIDTAVDDKGNILIALSGAWNFRDPGAKSDIYVLRSNDNGSTWSKPVTLRSDDVRTAANATNPSVIFGSEEGSAMVVWEDWRDIRSNVYASYSTDHGATWSEQPLPLDKPGAQNLGLDYKIKAISQHDGRYRVVAKSFIADDLMMRNLVLYSFTSQELQAFAEHIRKQEAHLSTEERLRERITSYWQAKQDDEHETAYEVFDPFFRARRSLDDYLATSGRIKYHSHEINSVDITDRIAKVQVTVEASVPEFTMDTGEKASRPKQSYQISETWLFIGDDWYREYYEEQGDLKFTRY